MGLARRTAATALALLIGAGCRFDLPQGGPEGRLDADVNEMTFQSTIRPLVAPRCTGCHAGMTPPNLTSFGALASVPKYTLKPGSTNILVTTDGGTGQHPVGIMYFTAAEKMTVASWIDNLH